MIGTNFNIVSDLLFARKGDDNIDLNYITLPIVLGYEMGRFNFELGPEVGFFLSGKSRNDIFWGNNFDYISNFDLSLAGGGTYYLAKKIYCNLRYVFSILQIHTYDTVGSIERRKIYNRSLQLSIGYTFNQN